MANEPRGYLKPGVKDPDLLRKKQNGQFSNPPLYMDHGLGGAKSKAMLHQGEGSKEMNLEKGGPSSKRGRPF